MAEAIAGETNSGPSNIANDNSKAAPAVSGAAHVSYPVRESNFICCLIPAAKDHFSPFKRLRGVCCCMNVSRPYLFATTGGLAAAALLNRLHVGSRMLLASGLPPVCLERIALDV